MGAPSPVEVRPTSDAITVDGILDEAAWREATPIPLPWEIEPGDNTPAPLATECRITFDQEHFYFGCLATEPDTTALRACPERVVAQP